MGEIEYSRWGFYDSKNKGFIFTEKPCPNEDYEKLREMFKANHNIFSENKEIELDNGRIFKISIIGLRTGSTYWMEK